MNEKGWRASARQRKEGSRKGPLILSGEESETEEGGEEGRSSEVDACSSLGPLPLSLFSGSSHV